MKDFKILAFLILALSGSAIAQTTREEMRQDLNKTGGVYYAYPVKESVNSRAPKGYEPFYISHYGRHGSRYLISDHDYTRNADILHKAAEEGALTPLGLDVMARYDSVLKEAHLRAGDLTPLGVRQHRGIAERMYAAYPEVFKDGTDISARSTLVVRCVLSMDAFCERLKELNPKLQITRESSQRYMPYLCYHSPESNSWRDEPSNYKEQYRKFENSHTKPERLIGTIFSDEDFVEKNVNPHDFMWNLYWIASGMQDIETQLSFYDLFTFDELFDLWQSFNYRFYVGDGNYPGSNGLIVANAKPLLRNIIESADLQIEKGVPGATLRFGHDGNLIPLAALMQLEGCYGQEENPEDFYKTFAEYKIAPMAGNIQMIFFKNKKSGDIIVKFMLNEREIAIPVKTDIYPFYRWDDVKNFYLTQVLN